MSYRFAVDTTAYWVMRHSLCDIQPLAKATRESHPAKSGEVAQRLTDDLAATTLLRFETLGQAVFQPFEGLGTSERDILQGHLEEWFFVVRRLPPPHEWRDGVPATKLDRVRSGAQLLVKSLAHHFGRKIGQHQFGVLKAEGLGHCFEFDWIFHSWSRRESL